MSYCVRSTIRNRRFYTKETLRPNVRTRDYLVGAVGILGALTFVPPFIKLGYFLIFFCFISWLVTVYSASAIIYKGLVIKTLTSLDLWRYLFYLCTNGFSIAAPVIAKYLWLNGSS